MFFYFKLQFQLFRRLLLRQAISPRLVMLAVALGFIPLSIFIFNNVSSANLIYAIVPLPLLFRLSSSRRNNFLQSIYLERHYRFIRLTENILLCLPFLICLLYQSFFTESLGLLFGSVALSFLRFNRVSSFVLPTPFYKKPFEFIVGFRKVFLLLPLAYALAVIGHYANNNNLGIAAIIFVFGLCVSFYNNPEKSFFVWIHKASPQQFLRNKIETGLLQSSILTLPILLFLCVTSPSNIDIYLLFQLGGYAFLIAVIIAKYASFPSQISFPQGIVIGVCLSFPPLILIVIPFLYKKALTNIQTILND